MRIKSVDEAFKDLGYTEWRSHQVEAIREAEKGGNGLIVIATGGGKSAIYQSLALSDSRTSLIISPLISLMLDQVKALKQKGVRAEFLNSSLSAPEERRIKKAIQDREVDLLYVSPEKLQSDKFTDLVKPLDIGLLVIDEAHCGLAWGFDFRPDYTRIINFVKTRPDMQVLAFTATATPKDQEDIIEALGLGEDAFCVVTSCDRPNLRYEVVYCDHSSYMHNLRSAALLRLMKRSLTGPAIVYCSTTKVVDDLYDMMSSSYLSLTYTVMKYHGKMSDSDRKEASKVFLTAKQPLCIATCAFGMGIDRPDIRQVYHYQHPKAIESYSQEVGRAGRDGKPCECYLLYNPKDRGLCDYFVNLAAWPENAYKDLVESIWDGDVIDVRTKGAGISHLERAKLVERHGPGGYHLTQCDPETTYSTKKWKDLVSWSTAYIASERKRISIMVDYAETRECRRAVLMKHFGQVPQANERCCDRHYKEAK